MKTIAIDASRAIRKHKTGVEWYAYRLLGALAKVAPGEWKVELLVDRPVGESGEWRVDSGSTSDPLSTIHYPLPNTWSFVLLKWPPRFLWSQIRLAVRLLRTRPSLYFSPVHVLPFFATNPSVVTIHDVDYMRHPEAYSWKGRNYLKLTTWWAVRRATRIMTPSEASKNDLVRYFGCDPAKIRVTPLAPMVVGEASSESPVASGPESTVGLLATGYSQLASTSPYFLFVGRLETKKNAVRIVEAFAKVAGEMPEVKLILVGRAGRGYEAVKAAIEATELGERIVETGWLPGEEVTALIKNSIALMFPSLAEGFGIPVLDGFALGVPVVTSRGIATEEVAGEAALLVDPHSVEEIAEAMRKLQHDPSIRESYVKKGTERLKDFSWEKTARMTVEVFREILGR